MRRREPPLVAGQPYPRKYITMRGAAAYLEVDPRTLNKFIAAGLLPCVPFGRLRRIVVADLLLFERERLSVSRASA